MSQAIAIPKALTSQITKAQSHLKDLLLRCKKDGGISLESYVRFLTFQYHLTKGVQRHFLGIASHPDLAQRKKLRSFLIDFAFEEEHHYAIARKDLKELGKDVLEMPFDVKLWWRYFDIEVTERPFVRLGATTILENIATSSGEELDFLLQNSPFLRPNALRFLQIHRHGEALPHGDQILEVLAQGGLTEDHWAQVLKGAEEGRILYVRMLDWALLPER
jgi:hypothetical protein